jgi:hypothetical protein
MVLLNVVLQNVVMVGVPAKCGLAKCGLAKCGLAKCGHGWHERGSCPPRCLEGDGRGDGRPSPGRRPCGLAVACSPVMVAPRSLME